MTIGAASASEASASYGERRARVALSRLVEPGDATAQGFVAEHGPESALDQILGGAGPDRWRSRADQVDPETDLANLGRLGGRLLIPSDDEWPLPLDDLGAAAPLCLWVRGPVDLRAFAARAVAVVGARGASDYGRAFAQDLGSALGRRGAGVVSGAAYGIDGAAHRGALDCGADTVAVLACGVDRCYPAGHDGLIGAIAERGAVVSEVPLGSSPTRWRFIERNRLIAGLGQVTVVVEAGHRSGAMITAGRASDLGRPVGAVPGPVTSAESYGCHRLLRDGAVCVTDADEVIELMGPIGAASAPVRPAPPAPHDGLGPADLRVFDALPLGVGVPVPSLARVAGLDHATVGAALGRLELRDLARRDGPGWRRAPRR